jgi:hypothetical protein
MTVAALVLSVVAILVAVASAVYTRRGAAAQEALTRIESARHLEERRPRLAGKVERIGAGSRQRLQLTLVSDEALAAMEVTIPRVQGVSPQGVSFTLNIYGVYPPRPGELPYRGFCYDPYSGGAAGLKPGSSITWAVELADEHVGTLQIEAACHGAAGELWDPVRIEAPVEPDISRTVY